MRVLLRVLAPLLGLALAAIGVLLVIEVAVTWVRPAPNGVVVPWAQWQAVAGRLTWSEGIVSTIGIGVGVVGLLLLLLGLFARRSDLRVDGPADEITVTTSPRVLAKLVGRRVRAHEDIAAASITASGRKISVTASGWGEQTPELRDAVRSQVDELLEQLPLHRRPKVSVALQERKGGVR